MADLSTIEFARRQRHLSLLKKVRVGHALTPKEITELERLETEFVAKKKKQKHSDVVEKKSARKPARLTAVMVKAFAMKYDTMAECESAEVLSAELSSIIKKNPALATAWRRGQLLQKLEAFGGGNASIAEVEHELAMAPGELERLFAADAEAAETFNNARLRTVILLRRKIAEAVEGDKITPTAARQIETMLRREVARKSIDYHHIPLSDMVELTGVSRQAIHAWTVEYGMSKNADGTYDLYKFIPWFERFTVAKITKEPGKYFKKGDDLQQARVDKIRTELAREKGQLLPREAVVAGLLARSQNILQFVERKMQDYSFLLAGQSAEKITAALRGFTEDIKKQMMHVPQELELNDSQQQELQRWLAMLGVPAAGE